MDVLSVAGLLIGLGAILGGNVLEGGHLGSLLNGPALIIVVGGSLGATLLQSSVPAFLRREDRDEAEDGGLGRQAAGP